MRMKIHKKKFLYRISELSRPIRKKIGARDKKEQPYPPPFANSWLCHRSRMNFSGYVGRVTI